MLNQINIRGIIEDQDERSVSYLYQMIVIMTQHTKEEICAWLQQLPLADFLVIKAFLQFVGDYPIGRYSMTLENISPEMYYHALRCFDIMAEIYSQAN